MKSVECEYETRTQYETLGALVQSFENGSVNMDKFLIWVTKKYKAGTSIILRKIITPLEETE